MRLISRAALALSLGMVVLAGASAKAEQVLLYFDTSEVLSTTLAVPSIDDDTQTFTLGGFTRAEVTIVPDATFGARISSFAFADVTTGNVTQSDIDFHLVNAGLATDFMSQSRNVVQKYLSNSPATGVGTGTLTGTLDLSNSESSLVAGTLRVVGTIVGMPTDDTADIAPAWSTAPFAPGTTGTYTLTDLGGGNYDIDLQIPFSGSAVIDPTTGTTLSGSGVLSMSSVAPAPIPALPFYGYLLLIAGLGLALAQAQRSSRSGLLG